MISVRWLSTDMLCKPGDLSLIPGTKRRWKERMSSSVVQITCAYMYTHTQFIKQKTTDINGKCIKRNTHV